MEENIQKGEVILYQPNETVRLEVRLENETVWLTQQQMVLLFESSKGNISDHLKNIFEQKELDYNSTVRKIRTVQKEGKRNVSRDLCFYNLDVIISVGFRVNTQKGILFRQWANKVLKEYLLKGYNVHPQLSVIQNQIIALQEHTDNKIQDIERHLERHDEQIDIFIKTNTLPQEQLFQNGCVFDAWSYVSALIRGANTEIILIDNYVDETILAILAKRTDGVTATIHTRYTEKFKTDLEKFNKQYPDKQVSFVQLSQHNHDRFLIIDEDVYLLGASLKDLGNTWGAIIKMNETGKVDILMNLNI